MRQIWLGFLDAERLTRYYGRLSDRMRRINFALTVFTLLASTAAFASLMVHLPDFVSALCFVAVAVALVWMHLSEYSKKAAIASIVAQQCEDLAVEWKELWFRQNEEGIDPLSRIAELKRRESRITALYDSEDDHALNEKCAEEAYSVAQAEFEG